MPVKDEYEMYKVVDSWISQLKDCMQSANLWENDSPPAASKLCSSIPFSADRMTFLQWLQWVFVPRLSEIIDKKQSLPKNCNIQPYAEEMLSRERHIIDSAVVEKLNALMKKIDQLLS